MGFYFLLEVDCFVFTKKSKIVLAVMLNGFEASRAHLIAPEDCRGEDVGGRAWLFPSSYATAYMPK